VIRIAQSWENAYDGEMARRMGKWISEKERWGSGGRQCARQGYRRRGRRREREKRGAKAEKEDMEMRDSPGGASGRWQPYEDLPSYEDEDEAPSRNNPTCKNTGCTTSSSTETSR